MNLSLEELIAQRASVAQHLAWLDAKIAQLNAERAGQAPQAYQQQSLQPQPESSPKVETAPVVVTPAPLPATTEVSLAQAAPAEPEIEIHLSPSSGISKSDKMGCIMLVVIVSVVGFLLMIGAGYLWRKAHPKELPTESQHEEPAR